jgi:hypothetical protein
MVEGILMAGSVLRWWTCFLDRRTKDEAGILSGVVGTRCRVSYLDSRNVEHAVDVTADSLFEAAAVAVRAFREGALVEELPVPGTELRITVSPLPVEHRVRLQRVEQWAQTGTVKSPVEMLRRERVRELLGLENEAVK